MTDHSERTHAPLSASGAYRWANCPGSVFLLKDMPPKEPTPKMKGGTLYHEASEIIIEDFLQHKLEGTDPDIRAHLLNYPDEAMELAQITKEVVWSNVLNGFITGKSYCQEDRLVIDEKLGMYGYADLWIIEIDDRAKRCATVVDYKSTYDFIPAAKNPQLAFYLVALRKMLRQHGKDIDYGRGVIVQPKRKDKPFNDATFTGKQLDTWEKKFYKVAHQVFIKQKPVFKVGSWCQYCEAQGKCEVYTKHVQTKTALQLVDADVSLLPTPQTIPDERLVQILKHEDSLLSFLGAAKAYVFHRHQQGNPIKGLKVVEGSSRRTWIKDDAAVIESLKSSGIDNPCGEPKLKGITAIESQLKKLVGKDKAVTLLQPLVTKTVPKLTITGEDDPRPEAKNLVGMFSTIEEEENE